MARANFVKSARKDYPDIGIKKGESYWWWQFRFGGKHMSKTEPIRSQLTQSAFLISIYDIEDRLSGLTSEHSVKDKVDQIKNDLEELKSECEEKFSNIPEQLQESNPGQLLQDRIDSLDNMISEIDGIDYDLDDTAALDEREAVIDDLSQISYQGS